MKLLEAVDAYVEGRRTYGAVYPNGIQTLSAFCRYTGDIPLVAIREGQVAAFLDGPATSEATWQNKYKYLRSFFLFWLARNAIYEGRLSNLHFCRTSTLALRSAVCCR
jgi:hypothetical protein